MRGGESILTQREKGYLLGLFAGDGYSYYDKKYRHYTVEFYLHSENDKKIQEYLIKILTKMKLKIFILKDKRYNCNRIRVYSKNLMNFLKLQKLNKKNTDFNVGFISGFIDSDGYVNHTKKYIQVVNTNKELMDNILEILKNLQVKSKLQKRKKSKKDKLDSYRIYIPYRFISLNPNSIKVNGGAT